MRVLIDACVLFPTVPREILLGCARAGLIVPLWSDRIVEEWRRAVLRAHPEQAEVVAAEIAMAHTAFPAATVAPDPTLEQGLALPDMNDRHVLAAAIAGKADTLVTRNLRDLPARSVGRHGIAVQAPDPMLLNLWQEHPARVSPVIEAVTRPVAQLAGMTPREVMKRAGLPRLGKALLRAA